MNEANTYVRPDNGLSECRACRAVVARESRQRRAAGVPETQRKFRSGYPEEMICRTCETTKPLAEFGIRARAYKGVSYRNRSCKSCCSLKQRDYWLRKRYGITAEEYDRLLERQGGVCALCATPPREDDVLSVDHEHATERVRGLLCQPCNVAVGFFETRIDVDRMREYLRS